MVVFLLSCSLPLVLTLEVKGQMRLYSSNKDYELYSGSMLDMLDVLEENSIDAIVTDPPYELNFMNKGWDNTGIAFQKATWEKCLKVLKPGGHLLAFGGSRTYHRIAVAIEDAGFELRDTIQWIYGSGMPKSMNIGLALDKKNGVESPVVGQNEAILKKQAKDIREGHRKILDSYDSGAPERNNGFKTVSADIREAQNEWKGWGTCLKPAYEPIIVARKPVVGTVLDNVQTYRVGGLNIDECRVPLEKGFVKKETTRGARSGDVVFSSNTCGIDNTKNTLASADERGRFPANVILSYDKETEEEVCSGFPDTKSSGGSGEASCANNFANVYGGGWSNNAQADHLGGCGDSGSAARYFKNCPYEEDDWDLSDDELNALRVENTDRTIPYEKETVSCYYYGAKASVEDRNEGTDGRNIHPTVKPTNLMQYLVRLVTPIGGVVLDPFNGSGSTGKAVMRENLERNACYRYVGIELTEEYLPIAKARIEYGAKRIVRGAKKEEQIVGQLSISDFCEMWGEDE